MEIVSYNVNGIRAAQKKGLAEWLKEAKFDVVCIQETKAQPEQINEEQFKKLGYECYWFSAEKKGYSGVGILTKHKPKEVIYGCGIKEYDREGRTLQIQFPDFHLINTYFPSGSSGDERQSFKMKFLKDYYKWIHSQDTDKIIHVGDFNICNKAIDIHDPVRNKDTSGFTPEEREWMDKYLNSGFIDTFRYFHEDACDRYSWWSYRAGARRKNKGWRIDYITASEALQNKLKYAEILDQVVHSDHCPVYVACNF